MTESADSLAHYGIKGMKWGVRRSDAQLAKARGSEDFKTALQNRGRPRNELSNKELKQLNERLNLEKNNKDLLNEGVTRKMKAGAAFVTAMMAVPTALATAYAITQTPAGKKVINMMTSEQSREVRKTTAEAVKKGYAQLPLFTQG